MQSSSIVPPRAQGNQTALRAIVVMANSLDCQVVQSFLTDNIQREIHVLESTSNLEFGYLRCKELTPDILIVDPKCAEYTLPRTLELAIKRHVSSVILLDDRLHEGFLAEILPYHQISYLTRETDCTCMITAVIRSVTHNERAFDPFIADRLTRTNRGWRLKQLDQTPSIAGLTTREIDILKLLAQGNSVRDCAELLQVSENTIDNHKTRMMKKLGIHKCTQLTYIAIRDGLVRV